MDVQERRSKRTNLAALASVVLLGFILWLVNPAAFLGLWERVRTPVVFVVTLGVLIFVHEMGHFLAAKAVGVRVIEFALGFGPKIASWIHRSGTEYTVRCLPLGGFVNMAGMQPDEADMEDGLAGKSAGARAFVFAAGPAMNLALALVILCLAGFAFGTANGKEVFVGSVAPNAPAERMGLKVGDRILSVRGVPVQSGQELQQAIRTSPPGELTMVVLRGSETLSLRGTPRTVVDDPKTGKSHREIGIQPIPGLGPRLPLGASIREGWKAYKASFAIMANLVRSGEITQSVGGPLAIFKATDSTTKLPIFVHTEMTASLSISLGVLNLLPIPILDGGHLMLLLIEVLRRRRLSTVTLKVAQLVGLAVIGVLFILIMYKDARLFFPWRG